MDKVLQDLLNAGIALFRAGEDTFNSVMQESKQRFEELKVKGASDTSEQAEELRKLLDDSLQQISSMTEKADSQYSESREQLEELFNSIETQIRQMLPEDQLNALTDKLKELGNLIKEKSTKKPAE